MSTIGKVEIPEGAKKEGQFMYLYDIVGLVKEHVAPPSLVLNLDQTPCIYPAARQSLAKKGAKSEPIACSTNKISMTGTFIITLSGYFLLIELIYGTETKRSLSRFPESLSQVRTGSTLVLLSKSNWRNCTTIPSKAASGVRKTQPSSYISHGCALRPDDTRSFFIAPYK